MYRSVRSTIAAILLLLLSGTISATQAEIVMVGRDTSGNLDNSGRDLNPAPDGLGNLVGLFGDGLATPIAPQYFVTSTHIGANSFIFNNGTSTATTYTSFTRVGIMDDLSVYKLSGNQTFSLYSDVYRGSDETGHDVVTIGRGASRGAEVMNTQGDLVGWRYGQVDGRTSYGTNVVDGIVNNGPSSSHGGFGGDLLQFSFVRTVDANGNVTDPDRSIYSPNDSGGATFVRDSDGKFKLAGINSLVDVVYDSKGNNVNASLFDVRGFYDANGQIITGPGPIAESSYATRISSRIQFLHDTAGISVPEPSSFFLAASGLGTLGLRAWKRRKNRIPSGLEV